MSHVATVDLEIRDLDALAEAAGRVGLELVRGQQTYRWYGEHVGDYPPPAGFMPEDLGKCEHALVVAGDFSGRSEWMKPYEIGVVRRRDGKPGFALLWDFYDGGNGLQDKVGPGCRNLKREYATVVARKQAIAQGFTVNELRQPDGSIRLRLTR